MDNYTFQILRPSVVDNNREIIIFMNDQEHIRFIVDIDEEFSAYNIDIIILKLLSYSSDEDLRITTIIGSVVKIIYVTNDLMTFKVSSENSCIRLTFKNTTTLLYLLDGLRSEIEVRERYINDFSLRR